MSAPACGYGVPRHGGGRPGTRPDRVCDKLAVRYEATLHIAALAEWLRPLTA